MASAPRQVPSTRSPRRHQPAPTTRTASESGPATASHSPRRRRTVEEPGERAVHRLVVGQRRRADPARVDQAVGPVRRRRARHHHKPDRDGGGEGQRRPSRGRTTSDQHQQHDEHERGQLHTRRDAHQHAGPAPCRAAPGRPAPPTSGTGWPVRTRGSATPAPGRAHRRSGARPATPAPAGRARGAPPRRPPPARPPTPRSTARPRATSAAAPAAPSPPPRTAGR